MWDRIDFLFSFFENEMELFLFFFYLQDARKACADATLSQVRDLHTLPHK